MALNKENLRFDQEMHDYVNFVVNRTIYNAELARENLDTLNLSDDFKDQMKAVLEESEDRSQHIKGLMDLVGDTSSSMPIKDYMDIMRELGFEQVFSEQYPNEVGERDQLSAYHEKQTGLFVVVDTDSHKDRIHSASLYGNWKPDPGTNPYQLFHHGNAHEDGFFDIHVSVVDGLKNTIEGLVAYGQLEPLWRHQPPLKLYNRADKLGGSEHDHLPFNEAVAAHMEQLRSITEKNISKLSPFVQQALGYEVAMDLGSSIAEHQKVEQGREAELREAGVETVSKKTQCLK